jgi:hypothetical protein
VVSAPLSLLLQPASAMKQKAADVALRAMAELSKSEVCTADFPSESH